MGALHTTLTGALLSGTFVAGWEGSHVELELSFKMAGGGNVCICDGADVCEWTKSNRSFHPTSVQLQTSIHYNLMHSQTHLGAIRCGRGTGRLPQSDRKNSCECSSRPPAALRSNQPVYLMVNLTLGQTKGPRSASFIKPCKQ